MLSLLGYDNLLNFCFLSLSFFMKSPPQSLTKHGRGQWFDVLLARGRLVSILVWAHVYVSSHQYIFEFRHQNKRENAVKSENNEINGPILENPRSIVSGV